MNKTSTPSISEEKQNEKLFKEFKTKTKVSQTYNVYRYMYIGIISAEWFTPRDVWLLKLSPPFLDYIL